MGSREEVKNSPGRRSVVPYTSSAAMQWISSFSAVRTSSSTMGSEVIQRSGVGLVFRAALHMWLDLRPQIYPTSHVYRHTR